MKAVLDFLGLTEARVRRLGWRWACWCEQRREWLNDLGEQLWECIDFEHYHRQQALFSTIVETALDLAPLSESSLCGIVSLNMTLSHHGTRRWLTRMVDAGLLAEMTMHGQRWLSLR